MLKNVVTGIEGGLMKGSSWRAQRYSALPLDPGGQ